MSGGDEYAYGIDRGDGFTSVYFSTKSSSFIH